MVEDRWDKKPNIVPWPPIIYALGIVAGYLLGHFYPIGGEWWRQRPAEAIGIAGIVAGVGFDLSAMIWMRRHRANILPNRAATALVTSGPFAISRNPIYLGNLLLVAGAAFAFANPWFLPAGIIAAFGVHHLAIRREEAHLAARFGASWAAYAAKTPRWLLL